MVDKMSDVGMYLTEELPETFLLWPRHFNGTGEFHSHDAESASEKEGRESDCMVARRGA